MKRSAYVLQKAITLLHNAFFIAQHRLSPTAFTRVRKLPFATIVSTLIHLCKKSLQIECNLLGDCLNMEDPASKQAFSKARYKISYTGFQALHRDMLKNYYTGNTDGLWKGFRLLGIDGSTCRLPDFPDVENYFGRWERGGGDRPGTQPVMARISEVTDLMLGLTVNGKISPWKTSEHTLAHEQIPEVVSDMRKWGQNKALFVFDRGYPSKSFFKQIFQSESDFIFRMPKGFNKTIDEAVSSGKVDAVLKIYPDLPPVRVVVMEVSTGETSVLLTSLTDCNLYKKEDFFEIYRLGWTGREEGYKLQKISLELENFIGQSKLAVLQEFFATLLAATVLGMHCADIEGARSFESPQEHRINRNVVMGSLREDILKVLLREISLEDFERKFERIANRSKVKVRPDRSYSREKVGKPKRHHSFRRVC